MLPPSSHDPIRECIFCTEKVDSGEHLFSKWIWKSLDGLGPIGNHFVFEPLADSSVAFSQGRLGKPGNIAKTLKCVCKSCNNGWMSEVENNAKPIVDRLRLNILTSITANERKNLSAWIALKTFLFEFTAQKQALSQKLRDIFKRNRLPPHGWLFACGQYRGPQTNPQFSTIAHHIGYPHSQVIPRTEDRAILSTIYEFSGLLFYSFAMNHPPLIREILPDAEDHCERHGLRLLWPRDGLSSALRGLVIDDVVIEYLLNPGSPLAGQGPFSAMHDEPVLQEFGNKMLARGIHKIDLRKMPRKMNEHNGE